MVNGPMRPGAFRPRPPGEHQERQERARSHWAVDHEPGGVPGAALRAHSGQEWQARAADGHAMNHIGQIIHTISYMALPLLLAMVFHEYAHGWVANRYGDSTAPLEGRLTLQPVPHIDPFGTNLPPLPCLVIP